LDTGIFSGNQKLPVRRSQTSKSFSSGMTFQLIAFTGSVWLAMYSSYSFDPKSTYLLYLESFDISVSQHTQQLKLQPVWGNHLSQPFFGELNNEISTQIIPVYHGIQTGSMFGNCSCAIQAHSV